MSSTPPGPEDDREPDDREPDDREPTVPFAKEEGGQPDYGRAFPQPPPPPGHVPPPGYPPPPGQVPPAGYAQAPGYAYPPGYAPPGYAYGASPTAPYGVHPMTGVPYSDKSKLVAGLLQILVPLGIGRMYIGDVGLGIAQLVITLVTCGIGALWPFIDGIVMLAGDPKDSAGRPLRS